MKKVISNVNVWNEMYYNNCYYSAIFPMLLHFGRSITPILLQNTYNYEIKDNFEIDIKSQKLMDTDDIFKEMGIVEVMKPKSSDIVADLKESIDNDKLSMVWIDCFFEKIRPDAYGLHHWGHILLVYGYDDESSSFEILEHSYIDSFTYKRAKMGYAEMAECYTENVKNFDDFSGYLEFSKSDTLIDVCDYHKQTVVKYIKSILENRENLYLGIENLHKTLIKWKELDYSVIYGKDECGIANPENFGNIIKFKKMQRYAMKKVFYCDDIMLKMYDEMIADWSFALNMLSLKAEPEKYFTIIIERLITAANKEKAILDKTIELYKQCINEYNYSTLDLSPYYNSIYISSKQAAVEGIPQWRIYGDPVKPETLAPSNSIMNFEGVPVKMPDKADDKVDNIMLDGQTISFEPDKYKSLYILGCGEFHEILSICNGSDVLEQHSLFFHDAWTGIDIWEADHQDKRIIAKIKGYSLFKSVKGIYLLKLDIKAPGKIIDNIKLPVCPPMRIFAITLER